MTHFDVMRQNARDIFSHALAAASVEAAFGRHVRYEHGALRVREDLFHLANYSKVFAISFGKAAHTMADALAAQLGQQVSGIVAAPESALAGRPQLPGFRYFSGGHPLPNTESLRAADAILKALAALPDNALILYLLSGGGSSIVERPCDADITLDDLIATYDALVHSRAPIAEINAIRKHLSAVKGGRLAQAAARGRRVQQVSILVSDVPAAHLDALASGPTMPDPTSTEDCYRIAAEHGLTERFPASVRDLFQHQSLDETPDKDDPCFHLARWWPVLSNDDALRAAAAHAERLGFHVVTDNSVDDQPYTRAADHLLARLRALRREHPRVCLLSGGEVTVEMSNTGEMNNPEMKTPAGGQPAGIGGRNSQFALYCAGQIISERITVLSAGTDGIDGNSPAAGAIADGSTLERSSRLGDAPPLRQLLASFNAYPFFHALADDLSPGPTGTNVRDVRIFLAY